MLRKLSVDKTLAERALEEWLAIRKEAGLKIDPETAEVDWRYALTLDPYGVYPELPRSINTSAGHTSPVLPEPTFGSSSAQTDARYALGKSISESWQLTAQTQ